MHPKLIQLLFSYLSDRFICIKLNHFLSPNLKINSALPQGSILSPILFSMFINDISSAFSVPFLLYADDLVFYVSGSDIEAIVSKLNSELDSLNNWCNSNGLKINSSKTKSMFFKKSNDPTLPDDIPPISLNGVEIEKVESFKYLGILLDSHLNFKAHSQLVENRTSSAVARLLSCKRMLPFNTFRVAFFAYVMSITDFCLPVWGISNNSMMKIQRHIDRLLFTYFFPTLSKKDKKNSKNFTQCIMGKDKH